MKKQISTPRAFNQLNSSSDLSASNKRLAAFAADFKLRFKVPELMTVLAVFILLTIVLSVSAQAQVLTRIPQEDPGPPFYARVERSSVHTDIVPHTAEWAAVVFYRSPSCVPPNFNLMDLFHIPGAFSCQLTIDGFEIWRNGPPPIDFTPMFARFNGLGSVPVWFVSWSELRAAVADDVLTLTELENMSSLRKGRATFFREDLHPTDGATNPEIMIDASGVLDDGWTTFQLHHFGKSGTLQTTIKFQRSRFGRIIR